LIPGVLTKKTVEIGLGREKKKVKLLRERGWNHFLQTSLGARQRPEEQVIREVKEKTK